MFNLLFSAIQMLSQPLKRLYGPLAMGLSPGLMNEQLVRDIQRCHNGNFGDISQILLIRNFHHSAMNKFGNLLGIFWRFTAAKRKLTAKNIHTSNLLTLIVTIFHIFTQNFNRYACAWNTLLLVKSKQNLAHMSSRFAPQE